MREGTFGRMGNFKVIDIEAGDPSAVKDSWFETYTASNFTMPQTSLYIDVAMARIVLKDKPHNWKYFSQTEWSKEQIDKLSDMMSAGHAHAGVNRATKAHTGHFENKKDVKVITEKRMKDLWHVTRDHTAGQLFYVFKLFKHNEGLGALEFLDNFFKDPSNKDKIEQVLKIIDAIYKAFGAKLIQEELLAYRKGISGGIVESDHARAKWFRKFEGMIVGELEKSGIDTKDSLVKHILHVFNFFGK